MVGVEWEGTIKVAIEESRIAHVDMDKKINAGLARQRYVRASSPVTLIKVDSAYPCSLTICLRATSKAKMRTRIVASCADASSTGVTSLNGAFSPPSSFWCFDLLRRFPLSKRTCFLRGSS